jgi:hypothetical protein
MKRLSAFVVSVIAAVFLLPTVVLASDDWTFNVFQPATSITGRSVQVEYTVASSDPSLTFTVDLFQNGTQVATQNVTNPYGASGRFAVTVPSAGGYDFMLVADDNDGRTVTESRSVTFVDAAQPTVRTVYQNTQTTGDSSSSSGGVVGDTAASTTNGNTLADTTDSSNNNTSNTDNKDNKDAKGSSNKGWLWVIPAAAVIGGIYFLNKRRQES